MSTGTAYRTVFDISHKGFDWWFPSAGVGFVILGAGLIWASRRYRWRLSKSWVGYFMVVFASLWSIGTFTTLHSEYVHLQTAYREGQFSVVEGLVHDFQPMPYEGHRDECFSVESTTFCYSDYGPSAGFNNSKSHGGPIEEGVPVRVSYVGETIVRLEVKDDALPSAEERTRFSEIAKAESQKRMEQDPVITHMNLGFGIAMVFMTGWWNLQWRRFMKFWMRASYKPATVLLFRAFLAVNFVGAVWYLIGQIVRASLSRSDYLVGLEVGAGISGIIWMMVYVVEWMNRRRI
jgi:hypothetical protein